MPDGSAIGEAVLEVIAPDAAPRSVRITQSPFLIGRSGGAKNHLQLSDSRISRSAAAISFDDRYYLEDLGQRGGMFLNGEKIVKHAVENGDIITFGLDGSYQLVFRTSASAATVDALLSRIENITHGDSSPGGLSKINLLLEATMLLHSQLPLDAVLGTMLDHAMVATDAEQFLREFRERLAKFGLELHADKTRLIEFGRFAARDRKRGGEGKPETFIFLLWADHDRSFHRLADYCEEANGREAQGH